MAMESPLFLTKVECPVCGTVNEFETIRVGAYSEGDRLTDFSPSYVKWRNPKYQKYHPLLFFTATCSNCFYTREFNNKFKEWGKDNNFRTYRLKITKERHLNNLASENSVLKILGQSLDIEKYPDETAISKLLIAIYDELLYDHPSNLDLGRFYLRIAWLFRHCGAEAEDISTKPRTSHIQDLQRCIDDLQSWSAGFSRNIDYLNEVIDTIFGDVEAAESDREDQKKEFHQVLSRLQELEKQCTREISTFGFLASNIDREVDVSSTATFDRPFYRYSNFDEFLVKLRRIWDGVPCSEKDARRLAVRYYISAFETGKEIGRGNQSIQAAYLIAELSRQVGDYDTARQYFKTTIKIGQDFIQEIKGDRTRTALARKILELAMAQGKKNLAEAK